MMKLLAAELEAEDVLEVRWEVVDVMDAVLVVAAVVVAVVVGVVVAVLVAV
jgi:hypothetical protein